MTYLFRVAGLLAGLALAGAASAQQPPADADDPGYADAQADAGPAVDPPGRVARLSFTRGAVSFVPAGENDWVEAQLNRPLVSGDKLWTDKGARAELQIGPAAIRADEQTSINFLNLDDEIAQVEMTQGTLNLRVRRLDQGQSYEVDTPTLAYVINRVGEYRIDVAPDGHGTLVTVFHGSGDAYGEAGARFRVEEGQSVRFNDPQLRDYASNDIPEADDFDRFSFERDNRWDASASRQYVSEDVIGYEDLDNNGSWSDEPEYGNVWYPSNVSAGWTPYSYGSWGWVGGYGWTWVDSSPWGFAPFHYGRWAYVHNRWGWCPGPAHVRPYYAPALVAFIGNGNQRVGFSTGAPVGWFPLGPRDVYVPGYRVSRDYFTRVNIYTGIGAVQINNYYGNYSRGRFDFARYGYANRNVAGAVTAVPGNVFVGARQVRGSALPVTRETFANSRVSGFAAVAPTRQSLGFGGSRSVNAPRIANDRRIIAATRPPPPVPSFAEREGALQRQPGRAIAVQSTRASQQATQTMQVRDTHRPNLDVVTSNGRPARLPAQALAPRGPVQPGQTNPGFRSSDRESRLGNAPGNTVEAGKPDARANRLNRPADNAAATQDPGQSAEQRRSRINATPETVQRVQRDDAPAVQQPYRSAPVDRTRQRTDTQSFNSGAVERAPQAGQPVEPQAQTRSTRDFRHEQAPVNTQPTPQATERPGRREIPQQEVRAPAQQDFQQRGRREVQQQEVIRAPQPPQESLQHGRREAQPQEMVRQPPPQQQMQRVPPAQQPQPPPPPRNDGKDGKDEGQQHGRKARDDDRGHR
ncbi:MAG: DUF6600 domain-containing protein [Rudaea sp.]